MQENNNFSFKNIWSLIMSIAYMAIGYFVIFTPYLLPYNYEDNLKENDRFEIPRIFLGVAMFLYGLLRGYKIIKSFKKK